MTKKNKKSDVIAGRGKHMQSTNKKKQKDTIQDSNNAKLRDIKDILSEELPLDKARRIVPAEKKYVRRTAAEFKAGAELPKPGESHRLSVMNVRVTQELKTAIKEAVAEAGVPDSLWLRAALRKAIREGLDVHYELETEIVLPKDDAKPQPK